MTYATFWPLLRLVLEHSGIPDTSWLDTVFFAGFALAATIVWTAFALGLRLWHAVEVAMTQRRIGPAVGHTVICSIAFAGFIAADQLVDGLRPCFDFLTATPGSLFLCILTPGNTWMFFVDHPDRAAQIKPWPSDDLVHYVSLAILALTIVGACFAFRRWRRV